MNERSKRLLADPTKFHYIGGRLPHGTFQEHIHKNGTFGFDLYLTPGMATHDKATSKKHGLAYAQKIADKLHLVSGVDYDAVKKTKVTH